MGDEHGDAGMGDADDEVVEGDLDEVMEDDLAESDAVDDAAVESGGVPVDDVPAEPGTLAALEDPGAADDPGAPGELEEPDEVEEPEQVEEPDEPEAPGASEASVSRVVGLKAVPALERLAAVVGAGLDRPPVALDTTSAHPTARFVLDGGEFVLASASPRADGGSTLSLVRGRMPDASRVGETKAELGEWLERVAP